MVLPYYDPAPVMSFLPFIPEHIPVVAYCPVDSCNVHDAHLLNRLAHAIFLSPFGLNEARQGGYTGPASVIGHGVDLDIYQPKDKATARHLLDLPQHAFLIGNVNTNAARKRFDLTLYTFKTFLETDDMPQTRISTATVPRRARGGTCRNWRSIWASLTGCCFRLPRS